MLISTNLQKSAFHKVYDIQERVHLIERLVKHDRSHPPIGTLSIQSKLILTERLNIIDLQAYNIKQEDLIINEVIFLSVWH